MNNIDKTKLEGFVTSALAYALLGATAYQLASVGLALLAVSNLAVIIGISAAIVLLARGVVTGLVEQAIERAKYQWETSTAGGRVVFLGSVGLSGLLCLGAFPLISPWVCLCWASQYTCFRPDAYAKKDTWMHIFSIISTLQMMVAPIMHFLSQLVRDRPQLQYECMAEDNIQGTALTTAQKGVFIMPVALLMLMAASMVTPVLIGNAALGVLFISQNIQRVQCGQDLMKSVPVLQRYTVWKRVGMGLLLAGLFAASIAAGVGIYLVTMGTAMSSLGLMLGQILVWGGGWIALGGARGTLALNEYLNKRAVLNWALRLNPPPPDAQRLADAFYDSYVKAGATGRGEFDLSGGNSLPNLDYSCFKNLKSLTLTNYQGTSLPFKITGDLELRVCHGLERLHLGGQCTQLTLCDCHSMPQIDFEAGFTLHKLCLGNMNVTVPIQVSAHQVIVWGLQHAAGSLHIGERCKQLTLRNCQQIPPIYFESGCVLNELVLDNVHVTVPMRVPVNQLVFRNMVNVPAAARQFDFSVVGSWRVVSSILSRPEDRELSLEAISRLTSGIDNSRIGGEGHICLKTSALKQVQYLIQANQGYLQRQMASLLEAFTQIRYWKGEAEGNADSLVAHDAFRALTERSPEHLELTYSVATDRVDIINSQIIAAQNRTNMLHAGSSTCNTFFSIAGIVKRARDAAAPRLQQLADQKQAAVMQQVNALIDYLSGLVVAHIDNSAGLRSAESGISSQVLPQPKDQASETQIEQIRELVSFRSAMYDQTWDESSLRRILNLQPDNGLVKRGLDAITVLREASKDRYVAVDGLEALMQDGRIQSVLEELSAHSGQFWEYIQPADRTMVDSRPIFWIRRGAEYHQWLISHANQDLQNLCDYVTSLQARPKLSAEIARYSDLAQMALTVVEAWLNDSELIRLNNLIREAEVVDDWAALPEQETIEYPDRRDVDHKFRAVNMQM